MEYLVPLALIVLASTCYTVHSLQSIPALLWSPERSMSQLPEVMGMDPIKTDDFLKDYLAPLMEENAVVFLQDKLHMDDFTKYADVYSPDSEGGAFKNIKSFMEDHFSLELPQVANPADAVEKLKVSFSGEVHTVKSPEEVEALNLSKDKKMLLIVNLKPVSGGKDKENIIQQNDAIVGSISRHLQKRSIKYSALFTGQSTSDDQAQVDESHSNRRLLAQVENTYNGTFLNVSDGQVFIFLRQAFIVIAVDKTNPMNLNLTVDDSIAQNTTRDNTSATIRLDFRQVPFNNTHYDVAIVTEAKSTQDRWLITRMYLDVQGGIPNVNNVSISNATLDPIIADYDFTIPYLYSWHCTDMKMFLDVVKEPDYKHLEGTYIRLTGYQLQPFNIQKDRFFDAQDCVSYFTTAIWMFLFSAIFLVSILIFGVLMVLSLSTMDKYDDPKGKTITVAQGTE